jgi:hypothetical protein
VAEHRHAVVRDLCALGYHGDTPITTGDFVSIVLASPPSSAVGHFTGGWSRTDHLLVNIHEQMGGLTELPQRYSRPGLPVDPDPGPIAPDGSPRWTAMSRNEFDARRAADSARGDELAATERRM